MTTTRSDPAAVTQPPAPEELEITIFGRGVGECILCHLGGRRWMMVDSFRNPDRRPVADAYLDALHGDHQIVVAAATHWDDDHTRGLADVVSRHQPREVWMSIVLRAREVFRFAVEHD